MKYEYHIEAVSKSAIFNGQEITKEKALRKLRQLEKLGYYAIKLVMISKQLDDERK